VQVCLPDDVRVAVVAQWLNGYAVNSSKLWVKDTFLAADNRFVAVRRRRMERDKLARQHCRCWLTANSYCYWP
jgi:hypothetical protein